MRNTGTTNSKPETGHVPASRAPTWARRTASVMIAAYGLASALRPFTQAWAQTPIADPRAPIAFQPSIQQQPGGGALVNITTPNSAGLSLNQYQRFDVPQSGVVLNNSLIGGNPLLGGQAATNPNLSGGRAATTIVNEVTAAGPAGQLRGSIEVFGNPAAVIVANPNGITCDGCGVVNTPRFTLSTGRVQLNDPLGNPSDFLLASQPGFDVAGGRIGIEGQGVEGTVGRLDLIGQSLRVDAPLRAHYLNQDISSINLVAGAARQVIPAFAAPQQPGGNRSGIAIDATALGAMTAGRISIISTEEGMGVRLAGPLLAYQEDIRIQSAGRIDAAGLAAARDIRLDSNGFITLAGETSAHGTLQANARQGMQISGTAQARSDIRLDSSQGGIQVRGDLLTGGSLDVHATAGSIALGQGGSTIQAAGDVTLAGQTVQQYGRLGVGRDLRASAAGVALAGDTRIGGNADIRGGESVLLLGPLQVNGSASVSAQDVVASGRHTVGGDFAIDGSRSVELGGSTTVGQTLSIQGGSVGISGSIDAGKTGINAGELRLGQSGGNLDIGGDLDLNVHGPLHVNGSVNVSGSAGLSSGGDATFDGAMNIGRDLGVSAGGNLAVNAPITAGGTIRLGAAGDMAIAGDVSAAGSIAANAGRDILVTGQINSAGSQRWRAGGSFTAQQGIEAAGLEVSAQNIGIAAGILLGGPARLDAQHQVQLGGELRANGSVNIQAGAGGVQAQGILANEDLIVRSQGGIAMLQAQAQRDVHLASSQADIQAQALLAGRDATLESLGRTSIDEALYAGRHLGANIQGGTLAIRQPAWAGGDAIITAHAITLAQGLQASGDMRLQATQGGIDSGASLIAGGSLAAQAHGSTSVQGDILAGSIGISAQGGSITAAGAIATPGTLTLDAGGGIATGGGATSGQDARLNAQGGDIRIGAGAAFGNGLQAQAAGDLHVQGDTLVVGDASLQSGGAQTHGGHLLVTGRLDATAGNGIDIGQELRANDSLALQAGAGGIGIGGPLATLGSAQLDAMQDIRIQGSAQFDGAAIASTQGGIHIGGGMQAQSATTLQARQDIHIAGDTLAQSNLSTQSSAGSITFGGNLDAAGDLTAHAAQDLQFMGDSLLLGQTSLRADNGTLRNQGQMTFAQAVDIDTTGSLANEGLIRSQADISIRARNIDSNLASAGGIVTPGQLTLHASGSARLGAQGTFSAGQDMALHAAAGLGSQGTIQAGQALAYSGGILASGGQIAAQGIAIGASLANSGSIYAQDGLSVSGGTSNGGNIAATSIDMASAGNSGRIGAQTIAMGATSNTGEIAGGTVSISGGLDNGGTVSAIGTLTAGGGGAIANDGAIAGGSVALSGTSIANGGQIQSGGQLSISGGSFDNRLFETRRCIAIGGCAADAPQENWQYTQNPGTVHAGGQLSIDVGSMSNQGVISAGGDMSIQASAGISNVRSTNDPYTSAGAGGGGASTGIISAGGSLNLSGASVTNAGGQIQAGGTIGITTGGAFGNNAPAAGVSGQITGSSLTVIAASIANQGALVARSGDLRLNAASGAVTNAAGASMLGANVNVQGASFSNAGAVYGQGGPAARIGIATSGAFSNAASGTVIAGSQLDIQAGGYGNAGGTVGSLGDVTYTSTSIYSPVNNPLLALGHLQLNVAGVGVGASEGWSYAGPSIGWTGTFTNAGSVAIAGNASGSIHNVATGGVFRYGEPNIYDGTYQVTGYPSDLWGLTDVRVVGYSDVGQRAQLYIGGRFQGSLVNEASDASVGGGSVTQVNRDQGIVWEGKNADGETVTVAGSARTLARLHANGGGGGTITLVGPDTGTIVGDTVVINGGNLTIQPGIDPSTGLPLVRGAQGQQVNAGGVGPGSSTQTAQGSVNTGGGPRPQGQDPGPIGAGGVGGKGGAGNPGGNATPAPERAPLNQPGVDIATPQGGVAALLGGGLPVAMPDWSQMRIVPGGISANDLQLNLNGQFTNRGELSVTNNLVINAAEGIDNFGASIRAGGYTSLSGASLDNRGGLIEAGSLLAAVEGGIDNSRGSITASNGGYLQAGGNITASEGRFASEAGQFVLDAGGNIDLAASTVQGKKGVGLYAEGDIRLGAIARTEHSETRQDNIVTLYAPGGNEGELGIAYEAKLGETHRKQDSTTHTGTTIDAGEGSATVRAKGDVAVIGSDIKAGKDVLVQGASVRIESAIDKNTTYEAEHRKNYDHALAEHSDTLKGGEVAAGGNLSIIASGNAQQDKGDIALKGAAISAQGQASLIASRDVLLQDQQTQHSRYEETYTKKSGLLSKKSTHTIEEGQASLSEGSLVTGDQVYVQAGRDIGLTGSHVIGQEAAALVAGRDITVQAGQDSASAESYSQTKRSGLFSGGGLSLTLGSRSVTTEHENTSVRAAGSSVQAQGGEDRQGNVTLVAGGHYQQTGSAVLAAGDVNIAAKSVEIREARELEKDKFEMRVKQSGLTVSVSNPALSAVQSGAQVASAMGKTSDARTQALGAAALGLNAYNNAKDIKEAAGALADGKLPTSVGINISVGSSQSRSTSAYQRDSAAGSAIHGDGNVHITATDGDLKVRGSTIEAGQDVALAAQKGNVLLQAAENRFAEQNSNSSSSASLGVGFNVGAGSAGFNVNASYSQSKGSGDGTSLTHTNTQVKAGGSASIQSGQDTTLKGAVIAADTVKADVGGNLTIESLQDTSRYNETSRSSGVSVSIPIGAGTPGASISSGRTQIDSDYRSVGEQSAIRAGDGGFQVAAKGDTTLQGGAITSTQAAIDEGKNRFSTGGQLTTSDIDNRAAYSASGHEVTLGVGSSLGASSAGVGHDSGNAASTSKAGISGVAGNSEARTGDVETGLKPIFDKNRARNNVDAGITVTTEFSRQGKLAINNYADGKKRPYEEARANLQEVEKQLKNSDLDGGTRAKLEHQRADYQQIMSDTKQDYDNWRDGGPNKIMADIFVAMVSGGPAAVGGVAVAGAGKWASNSMRESMSNQSAQPPGVCDAAGRCVSNISGDSVGVDGDGRKIGGGRLNIEQICDEFKCAKDEETKEYIKDESGNIKILGDKNGNPVNIQVIMDENPRYRSPLGGFQGGKESCHFLGIILWEVGRIIWLNHSRGRMIF